MCKQLIFFYIDIILSLRRRERELASRGLCDKRESGKETIGRDEGEHGKEERSCFAHFNELTAGKGAMGVEFEPSERVYLILKFMMVLFLFVCYYRASQTQQGINNKMRSRKHTHTHTPLTYGIQLQCVCTSALN